MSETFRQFFYYCQIHILYGEVNDAPIEKDPEYETKVDPWWNFLRHLCGEFEQQTKKWTRECVRYLKTSPQKLPWKSVLMHVALCVNVPHHLVRFLYGYCYDELSEITHVQVVFRGLLQGVFSGLKKDLVKNFRLISQKSPCEIHWEAQEACTILDILMHRRETKRKMGVFLFCFSRKKQKIFLT